MAVRRDDLLQGSAQALGVLMGVPGRFLVIMVVMVLGTWSGRIGHGASLLRRGVRHTKRDPQALAPDVLKQRAIIVAAIARRVIMNSVPRGQLRRVSGAHPSPTTQLHWRRFCDAPMVQVAKFA